MSNEFAPRTDYNVHTDRLRLTHNNVVYDDPTDAWLAFSKSQFSPLTCCGVPVSLHNEEYTITGGILIECQECGATDVVQLVLVHSSNG